MRKTTIDDTKTICVFWAKTRAKPYADYFKSTATMFVAIALPGGFSGFGSTSEDAVRMASARAMISKRRARACGLSSDDWFSGISRRMTPGLLVFLESHAPKAKDTRAVDGLRITAVSTPVLPRDAKDSRWAPPAVVMA